MSDDEDNITIFGSLLPQFAEDEIPTKKPKTIADQIAVDENGRRRFHGAFTGGFSAGFWNTVGSKDGWTPKTFKSSRMEKAGAVTQAPGDFMDEEDTGEFGIAPHRIQTTAEFTDDRKELKRARISLESDGPIAGDPVKNLFLEPVKGKIAVNLLRKMGWKDEAGFRSCILQSAEKPMTSNNAKLYHCDMGPMQRSSIHEITDVDDDNNDADVSQIILSSEKIVFKCNRFGLGYIGLTKYHLSSKPLPSSQHINLFAQFEIEDKMSKKVPIKGQAFGVGAFEEDDDDIYAKEDISNYDFSMVKEQKEKKKLPSIDSTPSSAFPGCVKKKTLNRMTKKIFSIDLPRDFSPTNWTIRKTRFGPVIHSTEPAIKVFDKTKSTPEERAKILLDVPKSKEKKIESAIETNKVSEESEEKSIDVVPKISENPVQTSRSKSIIDKLAVDRFVSEKDIDTKAAEILPKELEKSQTSKYEVNIKRTKIYWQPCKILCQKMNVCEPISGYKTTSTNKSFLFFENVALATKSRQKSSRRVQETSFVAAIESDDKELNDVIEKQKKIPPPMRKIDSKLKDIEPSKSTEMESKQSAIQPSSSSDHNVFKPKPVKKTALELRVLEEQDKHPVEKKDLFNSIFNSSDDDDDEETDNVEPNKSLSEITTSQLTKPEKLPAPESIMSLFDKSKESSLETTKVSIEHPKPLYIPKSKLIDKSKESSSETTHVSIDPSNSFSAENPKPIFIPKSKPLQHNEISTVPIIDKPKISTENFVYGPMIPPPTSLQTSTNKIVSAETEKPKNSSAIVVNSDSNDSWIEKSDSPTKERHHHRHKKSKKHKKQKHKSKKSKK